MKVYVLVESDFDYGIIRGVKSGKLIANLFKFPRIQSVMVDVP